MTASTAPCPGNSSVTPSSTAAPSWSRPPPAPSRSLRAAAASEGGAPSRRRPVSWSGIRLPGGDANRYLHSLGTRGLRAHDPMGPFATRGDSSRDRLLKPAAESADIRGNMRNRDREPQTKIRATCPACGEVELTPPDVELHVCTAAERSYYALLDLHLLLDEPDWWSRLVAACH